MSPREYEINFTEARRFTETTSDQKNDSQHCHVAVVTRAGGSYTSKREHGDYAAFIGPSRDNVVRRALAARKAWTGNGPDIYQVLVGELTGSVKQPVTYEVVPL
jgi:hypothetical protein